MFKINRGNITNQKELIIDSSGVNFIAQNDNNNGFVNIVKPQNHKKFEGNSLVVGRQTGVVYFQENDFITTDGVLVLEAKKPFIKNRNIGLALASTLSRRLYLFDYNNTVSATKINEIELELPVLNGKVNVEFLERLIEEIAKQRILKIRKFFKGLGLSKYELTKEEHKAIRDYKSLEIQDVRLVDIFNIKNSGNILSRDIVAGSGSTPYLCASADNNAVSSYISYDEKYLDKGNCVFIGGKTFVVTYQENDFFSNDSHNLILYLKDEESKNRLSQLFLATCVNTSLKPKYSWGDSISNKKIQKDIIGLPLKDGKPDYEYMETLMSAIQKLVIKDVVIHVEKRLAETKL